jgi:catechol 2,3-dioxygenase-like lactoylglutathione lyase family enzyme
VIRFHHIGVQTADIDGTVRWYSEFFDGGNVNWTLDEFSELTRSRLPGISRLVEFQVGGVRIHVYDRSGIDGRSRPPVASFQHCGLTVATAEELYDYRQRWYELARSGRFPTARWAEPSEVVFDSDGVGSLYVEDPNALEIELTYVPDDSGR